MKSNEKNEKKSIIIDLSFGYILAVILAVVLIVVLIVFLLKRKQIISENENDDGIKYPSDDKKDDDEQSNPIFEIQSLRDPFREHFIEE